MPTHLERSSLTGTGLTHDDWSILLSGVDWPLASPFANCLLWVPLSNSSRVPLPTSGHVEISNPNPLSGFALKQTKGSSAWRTTYIVLQLFPFAFNICSAIIDFSISLRHSAFRCFSRLTLIEHHVFSVYTLPQQHQKYYNNSSSCILLGAWQGKLFSKIHVTLKYCPDIVWTTYRLNRFGKGDKLWWVFHYCSLSFDPDFSEPVLHSLGSRCDRVS